MNSLPEDLIFIIASKLNIASLEAFCQIYKNISNNNYFWFIKFDKGEYNVEMNYRNLYMRKHYMDMFSNDLIKIMNKHDLVKRSLFYDNEFWFFYCMEHYSNFYGVYDIFNDYLISVLGRFHKETYIKFLYKYKFLYDRYWNNNRAWVFDTKNPIYNKRQCLIGYGMNTVLKYNISEYYDDNNYWYMVYSDNSYWYIIARDKYDIKINYRHKILCKNHNFYYLYIDKTFDDWTSYCHGYHKLHDSAKIQAMIYYMLGNSVITIFAQRHILQLTEYHWFLLYRTIHGRIKWQDKPWMWMCIKDFIRCVKPHQHNICNECIKQNIYCKFCTSFNPTCFECLFSGRCTLCKKCHCNRDYDDYLENKCINCEDIDKYLSRKQFELKIQKLCNDDKNILWYYWMGRDVCYSRDVDYSEN